MRYFKENVYSVPVETLVQTRICPVCGSDFVPKKHNQKYCSNCRALRWKDIDRMNRERLQEEINGEGDATPKTKKTKRKKSKTMSQVIKEMKAFNEKYGTCLSYGKYVKMMEHDQLDEYAARIMKWRE